MAATLLAIGAVLVLVGLALFDWRWAIVAAGIMCLAAGVDEVR